MKYLLIAKQLFDGYINENICIKPTPTIEYVYIQDNNSYKYSITMYLMTFCSITSVLIGMFEYTKRVRIEHFLKLKIKKEKENNYNIVIPEETEIISDSDSESVGSLKSISIN